ncbi:MAG: glycosyltransferase family 47 protein [Actinomycetota bacterium]|nr:glycosyltransferase family 47 protein [Actinomycetota bacterium]
MRELASADRFNVHRLIDDPEASDLVLFVESSTDAGPYFELVRRHPVYTAFRSKSYLFSSTDRIVPFLPGVYASVERSWYWPSWTRSGMYLGIRETADLRHEAATGSRSYLFSFIGSSTTHSVRRRLLQVRHPDGLIIDTAFEGAELEPTGYTRRHAESIARSAFVLCPRGGGTSTFRLFETMMLGRVPVIISDQWVPPVGPDWQSFSVRVGEGELEALPALLEERQSEAVSMGEAARLAWLDWFSETTSFHRIVDWCLELAEAAPARGGVRRRLPYVQMLRPYHAVRWILRHAGHGEHWHVPQPARLAAAVRARPRRR